MNFKGSYVALITPFTSDGIDRDALANLIEYQISNGTDGIVVLGTTGEPATMTAEERREVTRIAKRIINGRVPMIVGTGCNCSANAVRYAKDAEEDGADALLVVTPYYNKATQKGIIEHYRAIKNAVNIPIIAYNVPGRTGVNILPKTVKTMAEEGIIDCIKEASGNVSQITETLRLTTGLIPLLSGDDGLVVPIMSMGGMGVISVVANVAPLEMSDLVHAMLRDDYATARNLQFKFAPLVEAIFSEVNPIPVKAAAHMMGLVKDILRLPLTSMESDTRAKLKVAMENFGLL